MHPFSRYRSLLIAVLSCTALAARAESGWSVALSDSEKQWIAAHPTIRVGHGRELGPFSFVDSTGQLAGLGLDLLAVISAKTGLVFDNRAMNGLSAAFEGVKAGTLDGVMAIGKTDERETFLHFSATVAYSPDAIVTRSDAPFLFDIRSLGGKRVAIAASSVSVAQSFADEVPDAVVVKYASMAEAVRAVAQGDAFAAVTDASAAAFTAKQERLTNLRIGGIFSAPANLHFAARRDFPELIEIVDKVLKAMPAAELTQLNNRWVVLDYESDRRFERAFTAAAIGLGVAALLFAVFALESRRRKKIQAKLEVANEALALVSREKSELMRMIAHDLRNPLAVLALSAEAMALPDEVPSHEIPEVVGEMRAAIARMVELLNTLVEIQALEEGKRSYRISRFDLGELTRSAAKAMSDAAQAKSLRLEVQTAKDLVPVESDAHALRQVVDNLLSNAIKYSPMGTAVKVEVIGQGERQLVEVRDQGPGLTAEDKERIFQKYGTGSAKPTGGERSTGLGLWIVQQIALGLHGAIRCESEPGKGAAFTFEIPVKR